MIYPERIPYRNHKGSYSVWYRASALIYFLAMVLYLFRPVLPFLEYSVNKAYISENLCINRNVPGECCKGKCYLHEQLKKYSDTTDSEKNNNKKVIREKGTDDHLKTEVSLAKPFASFYSSSEFYFQIFSDSYYSAVFVPPKL